MIKQISSQKGGVKINQQLVLALSDVAKKCDVTAFLDGAIRYYTALGEPCPPELTKLLDDDVTKDEKVREMQKLVIEIHNAMVKK